MLGIRNLSNAPSVKKKSSFKSDVSTDGKLKILNDSKIFFTAYEKTLEIWEALQISNYKKEGVLNRTAVEVFFQSQSDTLRELLLVKSSDELMELIDHDEDGVLNEEDQLLIFSIIKKRMDACANQLCAIKEYKLYENMIESIKKLESDILTYQTYLRNNINKKHLENFYKLKDIQIKEFEDKWDKKFKEFETEKIKDLKALKEKHDNEIFQFNADSHLEVNVRVKSFTVLKLLKTQEKFAAIDEKFFEASMMRDEIEKLENAEKARAHAEVQKKTKIKVEKLKKKQEYEINYLNSHINEKYLDLKYQYNEEKSRIIKMNEVKINELISNQKLSTSFSEKIEKFKQQIHKIKEKSLHKRQILSESKLSESFKKIRINFSNKTTIGSLSRKSYSGSFIGKLNYNEIKPKSIKPLINSMSDSFKPMIFNSKIAKKTLENIKGFKHRSLIPSLCALYDEKLDPKG
jgi:PHD/YefM family antitoxin component YafN of YafNO toxin-antitoxin module